MALDPSVEYVGQVDTSDAGYPYGKPQNVTVEGDGTGTPLEAALVSDIFGFQQALLVATGITPSGTPDKVGGSQYLQALVRILRRADGWGAVGDDAADDTTPLQNALNAFGALAGRQDFHFVPGKTYRTTGLSVPANVDLYFNGATLKINHATNALLTYSSAVSGKRPLKIVDAVFASTGTANSGPTIFLGTTNVILEIEDCWFGSSSNTNGKFVDGGSITGQVTAKRCVFEGRGDAIQVHLGAGVLREEDCRHIVPATYSNSCVKVGAGQAWVSKASFELTAHSSGTMACIEVTSANSVLHLDDNDFLNDTDPATSVAIKWGALAAKIVERGSTFAGNITPYSGSVVLADGSSLELRQHGTESPTTETYTIPDDFESFTLVADNFNTFPIALTMPKIRFIGQEFDLQVYNKGVTPWATTPDIDAMGPDLCTVSDPLNGAFIKTGRFRVMLNDFGADYRWTLVGGWSEAYQRGVTIG